MPGSGLRLRALGSGRSSAQELGAYREGGSAGWLGQIAAFAGIHCLRSKGSVLVGSGASLVFVGDV